MRFFCVVFIVTAVLVAGCLDGAGTALQDTAVDAASEAPVVETVDFAGDVGPTAFACAGVALPCVGQFGGQRSTAVKIVPGDVDITLQLSWDALGPDTQELVLFVVLCDDGCENDLQQFSMTGRSPLLFEESLTKSAATEMRVFVNVPNNGAGPVDAFLASPQPFALAGEIVIVPAA